MAQTTAAQKSSVQAPLTAKWLAGHWSAARADVSTYFTGYTISNSSTEYWLDMDVSILPDKKIEALVTVRQMGDETEFATWKSDVTIKDGLATFTPSGIVGKKEWWGYSPDTFQLKRRDNKLVGRVFNRIWGFEFGSGLITLER